MTIIPVLAPIIVLIDVLMMVSNVQATCGVAGDMIVVVVIMQYKFLVHPVLSIIIDSIMSIVLLLLEHIQVLLKKI